MALRFVCSLVAGIALTTSVPDPGWAGSNDLINGSLAIEPSASKIITFTTYPGLNPNARLRGMLFAHGGTGNDMEVLLLNAADFLNWQNGHQTQPLYNSGRVTVAEVDARLPKPGTYVLVVSNAFSLLSPKTVEGKLAVEWGNPLLTPNSDGLFLAFWALAATVALVVWSVSRQRKKARAEPARPAPPSQ